MPPLADLQGDDLKVRELEPVMEVDGISGEIAGQMRGDDSSIRCRFDRQDFGMEVVLAPRLLCPGAHSAPTSDVAAFIAHHGVLGEASSDAVGVIGIGRGEIFTNGLGQLHVATRGYPGRDPA